MTAGDSVLSDNRERNTGNDETVWSERTKKNVFGIL